MYIQSCVDGSKIRAMKSLQFDLSIIEAATNNFAEVNKIGAGGFGSVYKVRKIVLPYKIIATLFG